MEPRKSSFQFGLTFDDVLLVPGYSDFSRKDINLSTSLTKRIQLSLPLVSAPMDTVTESELAIELAKLGGIGIIHRNLSIENQALEVKKVKETHSGHSAELSRSPSSGYKNLLVGAAVGVNPGFEKRVMVLSKAKVDVIVLDSAHGFTSIMLSAIRFIKKTYPKIDVIAGNIATADGAKALIEAGADGLRVGMGPGAICTTRIIAGMGVPQLTAILQTSKAAKKLGVPVIADGGIKYSGDMVKALAAGASTVMMGGYFAQCLEAPGKTVILKKSEVPSRFQSLFNHGNITYRFKEYRGMGSEAAMKQGSSIKSEGEFHGKDYKDKVLVSEGVEGLVPVKGKVLDLVNQAVGGITSGMYYVGAKNISQLQGKAKFIQITQASLTESHPHDIFVTNPGKNYA